MHLFNYIVQFFNVSMVSLNSASLCFPIIHFMCAPTQLAYLYITIFEKCHQDINGSLYKMHTFLIVWYICKFYSHWSLWSLLIRYYACHNYYETHRNVLLFSRQEGDRVPPNATVTNVALSFLRNHRNPTSTTRSRCIVFHIYMCFAIYQRNRRFFNIQRKWNHKEKTQNVD